MKVLEHLRLAVKKLKGQIVTHMIAFTSFFLENLQLSKLLSLKTKPEILKIRTTRRTKTFLTCNFKKISKENLKL